jgi:hypothetical protein
MKISIEEQIKEIVNEYKKELSKDLELALTNASELLKFELELASPVGDTTPHFRDMWDIKTKYTGVRYVGNKKLVESGIPLSNLLEYARTGRPFIARTYDLNLERIYESFITKLKGGLK